MIFYEGHKVYMNGEYPAIFLNGENQHIHRLEWIKHYGKIPKGHVIMFLDGDNTNFDISNLACVENKNKLYIQSRGLISHNKKMTETGLMISELYYKTKSVKKND